MPADALIDIVYDLIKERGWSTYKVPQNMASNTVAVLSEYLKTPAGLKDLTPVITAGGSKGFAMGATYFLAPRAVDNYRLIQGALRELKSGTYEKVPLFLSFLSSGATGKVNLNCYFSNGTRMMHLVNLLPLIREHLPKR